MITFALLAAFAQVALVCCIAAVSDADTATLPLVVIEGGGNHCPTPGATESQKEAIFTILQDWLCRESHQLGSTPECPGSSCAEIAEQRASLPSGSYYVLNSTGSAVQVYCEMGDVFPDSLNVTNGWVKVANLNMTDPEQQCPESLQEYTDTVRVCGKSTEGAGCDSVTFTTFGFQYKRVCGRAIGYQLGSPGAFDSTYSCGYPCNDTNRVYVDGLSITHSSPRQHIWTYAAGYVETSHTSSCPCVDGREPPVFVGSDYYCESGRHGAWEVFTVYSGDPLWDGQVCHGDEGTCCDPPNLPWFCKELPQTTTDDLEVRICMDEILDNENVLIELLELYIQ